MENTSPEVLEELCLIKAKDECILHLNYQGLDHLPKELLDDACYRHVRRIYLKRNRLKRLPEEIGILTNLVELYLHSNSLEELPQGIASLQNLESLDISNNHLTSLPDAVAELHCLEQLHVANNRLQTLPTELGKLDKLQLLDVINNQIRDLPIGISQCKTLERLLVDRNHLTWLPRELCNMLRLSELSATGNSLLCLPMDIGNMESLKRVYVDKNCYLHALPVTLYTQEIGFNSSGTLNYEADGHRGRPLLNVTIESTDDTVTQRKVIYLPKEIQELGDKDSKPVVTLLELALRVVYKHRRHEVQPDDLPGDMYTLLQTPVASCGCCEAAIFTMGFPMVFEGQVRVYRMYRLSLCCSVKCVRLAAVIINLPLIYPCASTLHRAIALIDA